jgi:hypothetical protein
MLGLTLMPAEAWHQPSSDVTYAGFDPNLVYAAGGRNGSAVSVSSEAVEMTAAPRTAPAVLLATTLLPKFRGSVDVTILGNEGAQDPLRVGIWSPWTVNGVFVDFGPAPKNEITIQTISDGAIASILESGKVVSSIPVGSYTVGTTYAIGVDVDRQAGKLSFRVSGSDLSGADVQVPVQGLSDLMSNVQMSLSAGSAPGTGAAAARLSNYQASLPHQRWWADKIDDARVRLLLIALSIMGSLLLAIRVGLWVRDDFRWRKPVVARLSTRRAVTLAGIGIAIAVYLAGNAFLFRLGGHPFDFGAEKLYAYTARTYGLADLFYLPNIVSLARVWLGVPYVETAFPYGPTFAFISAGEGWLTGLLSAKGGAISLFDIRLDVVIKSTNVAFGLADAVLIYAILRKIGSSRNWSLIAAALFLFNPAVWFSVAVWGQTHVISLFFVLLAVWMAEMRLVALAWLALAAATMTRPQMIVFAFIVGIIFLRKFTWRENLSAISIAVIATFVAILPMTLGTSPSLPVDITLNNFRIHQQAGNTALLSPVSLGGYSVWPLVTYLVAGQLGSARVFVASSEILAGGLTYQQVSQILTVLALVIVGVLLWLRRKSDFEGGGYLPQVALAISLFLMLVTEVVGTHFLLALPFLILCRRWMTAPAFWFVIIAWTVTTFVAMYGEMGTVLTVQSNPLLEPSHNRLTNAFIHLYGWDRFISVAVTANLCVVAWLAYLTWRRPATSARATPAT